MEPPTVFLLMLAFIEGLIIIYVASRFRSSVREAYREGFEEGRKEALKRSASVVTGLVAEKLAVHLIRSFIYQVISFCVCYGWVHHGLR